MARALYYIAPGQAALRDVSSRKITDACSVRVRTLWSGLSRGTERLVFMGNVPESEYSRMRAPHQDGDFPFPVKYGYANVGVVDDGPSELLGTHVFSLFPHQDFFAIPGDAAISLPVDLPPRRAILAANMETALNAVWDSGAGPGDRIGIVGAGLIGVLLAGICGRLPGAEITLIDRDDTRQTFADHMNVTFRVPADAPEDCDIVFHCSATENGAATALACAGFESCVVELSWFGDRLPRLPLGEAFHSKRLTYMSSQVGHVSPSRRPRWSHRRRLAKALDLLCDDRYDALITEEVAFDDLPTALPRLLVSGAPGLATAIRY